MSDTFNIDFDFSGVQSVISQTDAVYTDIATIISKINTEANKLSTFWSSSKESVTFNQKLTKVYNDLLAFDLRYAEFMQSLEEVVKIYGENNISYSNLASLIPNND